MSPAKTMLSVFLLTCFAGLSNAQVSMPLYTTTYCVQVKYEMWRNGNSYWSTKFETSDLEDAQLMLDLFEIALEDGSICEIFNCGFDWIIVDVRLYTKYEWNLPTMDLRPAVKPIYRRP